MHRLVAEHVRKMQPAERAGAVHDRAVGLIEDLTRFYEQTWRHDPAVRVLFEPMRLWIEFLLANTKTDRRLALSAGVIAAADATTGLLSRAIGLAEQVHTALRALSEANPDDAQAQRDLSTVLNDLGDFWLRWGQAGDAERALACYEEDLGIARRLAADNPGSAEAARDLSVSLNKLGDFWLRRGQAGDAERALACYEESLGTRRRLAADNPGSAQAARDLSVSLNKLGDFWLRRGQAGDAERALGVYEECAATMRRLAADNPGSAQAARDLSVSLDRLGDFWLGRGQAGDAERALACYEESLGTRRRLAADNPGSAQAARDLSVSLVRMGQVRGQAGDHQAAVAALAEAFAILDGFATGGRPMDQQMIAVHRQLRAMFAGGGGPAGGG